jgi:hypothetical protein
MWPACHRAAQLAYQPTDGLRPDSHLERVLLHVDLPDEELDDAQPAQPGTARTG